MTFQQAANHLWTLSYPSRSTRSYHACLWTSETHENGSKCSGYDETQGSNLHPSQRPASGRQSCTVKISEVENSRERKIERKTKKKQSVSGLPNLPKRDEICVLNKMKESNKSKCKKKTKTYPLKTCFSPNKLIKNQNMSTKN